MKKTTIIVLLILLLTGIAFRVFVGIFVIQPIGILPEGVTIVYWRSGLNLPFIASVDGLMDESGAGVSLFGRGMFLAKLTQPLKEREIFRFGYSETLYLWSTNGKKYEK